MQETSLKQHTRQNKNPIISQKKITTSYSLRTRKTTTTNLPPATKAQAQVIPKRSLQKPLDKPYPPRAEKTKGRRNFISKPEKKDINIIFFNEKTENYCANERTI